MTITIDVTGEDIKNGITADCVHCPIAQAASRAFVGAGMLGPVVITRDGLCFDDQMSGTCSFALPQSARVFISRFDAGWPCPPFSFAIDLEGDARD